MQPGLFIVSSGSVALGRTSATDDRRRVVTAVISFDPKSKSLPIDPNQLIVSRTQACAMLGNISVSTLRRHMKAGRLHAVSINSSEAPRRRGKLYFNINEVLALIPKAPAASDRVGE
jgi:hypothetical protein